jgi:hypothetical protein
MAYRTEFGDYDQMYGRLPVDGLTVLDIGADYGTTAEYFLSRGARVVFVTERRPEWRAALEEKAKADGRIRVVDDLTLENAWTILLEASPDAVKVDCERCETFLLSVPPDLLARPMAWVMETHTRELYEEFKWLFHSLGYTVETVEEFPNNPPERCVKVILATREVVQ